MGKLLGFIITIMALNACAIKPLQAPKSQIESRHSVEQYLLEQKKREFQKIDARLRRYQKQDLLRSHSYALPDPLTADTLYSEAIKAYRIKNQSELQFYAVQLKKRFPTSIHIDNALYLRGRLSYDSGQVAQSISFFQEIIQHHKSSNKRPAALLMKARAYTELNLKDMAKEALKQISKEYPGSPESYQADAELSLLLKT